MAVDAVTGVTPTTTTPQAPGDGGNTVDYTQMTPKEILEAKKNGETIPPEILKWAKENPDSKITYAESQGGRMERLQKMMLLHINNLSKNRG